MRIKTATMALAMLAFATGCGEGEEAEAATPSFESLKLEVAMNSAGALSDASVDEGQTPEFVAAAKQGVRRLHEALQPALEQLREILESGVYTPGEREGTRIYGPVVEGDIQYRLTIRRLLPGFFGWKLEAAAADVERPEWQVFMAGTANPGATPHRGRGTIGMNLDVLAALDADFTGEGQLRARYIDTGDAVTLAYQLVGFTPDPAAYAPLTAAFVGHREDGVIRVRLVTHHDLQGSGSDAQELVRVRLHHLRGIGGRADAFATGGDVPADQIWLASACWDPSAQELYKVLRACSVSVPGSCEIIYEEGDATACPLRLREVEMPEDDLNAADGSLRPPADFPTGDDAAV